MSSAHDVDTSKEAIVAWCQAYLADLLGIPAAKVDPGADFDRLGIDSALAVALLSETEERYGVEMAPEALFENPNLNAVAQYLHEQAKRAA
ncbi:MAG: acyl carrier protein [Frankiaceae bacterium]